MTHVFGFEHPVGLAIVIDVVPPSQAHQQSSRDILHRPEVGGEEQDDEHKAGDEGVAEPAAEHVNNYSGAPEEQVEKRYIWVPAGGRSIKGLIRNTRVNKLCLRVFLSRATRIAHIVLLAEGYRVIVEQRHLCNT